MAALAQSPNRNHAGNPDHFPMTPHAAIRDGIVAVLAAVFSIPAETFQQSTRGHAASAFARQTAMYLAHTGFGLSYSDAGRLFNRDRTTAAHACRVVEDRRDDPKVDRLLQNLEQACHGLVQAEIPA